MPALRRILDSERLTALAERHHRTLFLLAALGLIAIWIDLFLRVIEPELSATHFPTSSYWVAPRLVLEGRGELLLDHEAFADAAAQLGAYRDLGFIPNAPMGVLPLLPLGLLPEASAYHLWTSFSVLSILAAVVALVWTLRLPTVVGLLVLGAAGLFHPMRSNIDVGQAYGFVLLAMVATAIAVATQRSALAIGLAQSAVAILKVYYGLVLLLPELARRRWRPIAVVVGVLGIAAVASALLLGPQSWSAWLSGVLGWRSRPETSVTAFQTLHSLTSHLFRYDGAWNPAPVADAPLAADLVWAVCAAAMLLITWLAIKRAGDQNGPVSSPSPAIALAHRMLPLAAVVPVALVLSPIAEDHAYIVALFPLVTAGAALLGNRPRAPWWWLSLAAAFALLAPAWPFNQAGVEGWWTLLFYPRVYGALLLWATLVGFLWRTGHERPERE